MGDKEPLLNKPEPHVQYGGTSQPEVPYDGSKVFPDTSEPRTHLYKRRWYLLFLFSLMAYMQSAVWNTWGPIADSVQFALGWSDGELALMPNYGTFAFLPTVFFFSYLLDVKGLRWGVVTCAVMVAAGCAIRCISIDTSYGFALISIGAFLNGLGGPVCMAAPPVISSVWFPPGERTTSTSLTSMAGYLGVAGSFVMGPYLVRSVDIPPTVNYNTTLAVNASIPMYNISDTTDLVAGIKSDVRMLMYIEAGVMGVIMLLIIMYFPATPALPPSISAASERQSYLKGIKGLIRNGKFWLIGLSYGISLGVYGCWNSVLDVILDPHGISQDTAGWLGFYSQLGGVIAAIIGSRIADKFSGHLKRLVIAMVLAALAFSVWLILMLTGVLPSSTLSIYISLISGGVFLNACIPLYFELAIETCYPIGEGMTAGLLTWINNLFGMIFLLGLEIPGIGTMWTNYFMGGGIALVLPLMIFYRETYNRLSVDTHGDLTHADRYTANS